jgi:hypothetical protein
MKALPPPKSQAQAQALDGDVILKNGTRIAPDGTKKLCSIEDISFRQPIHIDHDAFIEEMEREGKRIQEESMNEIIRLLSERRNIWQQR